MTRAVRVRSPTENAPDNPVDYGGSQCHREPFTGGGLDDRIRLPSTTRHDVQIGDLCLT